MTSKEQLKQLADSIKSNSPIGEGMDTINLFAPRTFMFSRGRQETDFNVFGDNGSESESSSKGDEQTAILERLANSMENLLEVQKSFMIMQKEQAEREAEAARHDKPEKPEKPEKPKSDIQAKIMEDMKGQLLKGSSLRFGLLGMAGITLLATSFLEPVRDAITAFFEGLRTGKSEELSPAEKVALDVDTQRGQSLIAGGRGALSAITSILSKSNTLGVAGDLLSKVPKFLGTMGSLLTFGSELASSGDPFRATAGLAGSLIGGVGLGAIGTAAGPVGTITGGAAGAAGGEYVGKWIYDQVTDAPTSILDLFGDGPLSVLDRFGFGGYEDTPRSVPSPEPERSYEGIPKSNSPGEMFDRLGGETSSSYGDKASTLAEESSMSGGSSSLLVSGGSPTVHGGRVTNNKIVTNYNTEFRGPERVIYSPFDPQIG